MNYNSTDTTIDVKTHDEFECLTCYRLDWIMERASDIEQIALALSAYVRHMREVRS